MERVADEVSRNAMAKRIQPTYVGIQYIDKVPR